MLTYIIIVSVVVALTSLLLVSILKKTEILNYRIVLVVALCSVIISLFFPSIFNLSFNVANDITHVTYVLVATILIYIILTFIISLIITNGKLDLIADRIRNGFIKKSQQDDELRTADDVENQSNNYIEQIYDNFISEKETTNEDITPISESYLEKSVDSDKNIDKMGLEVTEDDTIREVISEDIVADDIEIEDITAANEDIADDEIINENINENIIDNINDINEEKIEDVEQKDQEIKVYEQIIAESLSIDECVEEAFRRKSQEDLEGAVLYYMYALDKKPENGLVFWIVLDICVLYKALGQIGLARDILNSYKNNFSEVMDASVSEEIERNLI